MTNIIQFPKLKDATRLCREATFWYDEGFEWGESIIAAFLSLRLQCLESKVKRLEGKKNSKRRVSHRMRSNIMLMRNDAKHF